MNKTSASSPAVSSEKETFPPAPQEKLKSNIRPNEPRISRNTRNGYTVRMEIVAAAHENRKKAQKASNK